MTSIKEVVMLDQGTVGSALYKLYELLQKAPDDAKLLFDKAIKRVQDLCDRFPDKADTDARRNFINVIDQLLSVLTPYIKHKLAARVIKHLKLKRELTKIHDLLNGIFRRLDLTENVDNGGRTLYKDIEDHAAKLELLIDNAADQNEIEQDLGLYHETMAFLQHAENSRDPDNWNLLAQKLKRVVERLHVDPHVHEEAKSKLPSWFVPLTDVSYHPTSFDQGSFGAVHRGTWGSATPVVVKILLDGQTRLERSKFKSFLDEANLWSQFTHPNCLRMFGACHLSSPPFIICEDATHGNLLTYLALMTDSELHRQTKLWRRLYEASLGIEYLHNKGVIHYDLKLDNILVGRDGYARIGDFGLSSVMESTTSSNGVKVGGALRWRAPELFNASDIRTVALDVYSFGMCIYEALTEEIPYADVSKDDDVKAKVVSGERPPRRGTIPDDIWTLFECMTSPDPIARPSIKEVIAQLKTKAQAEDEKERSKFILCEQCEKWLPAGSNYCSRCSRKVKTKSVDDETIHIRSSKELPRIINMLSLDRQKVACLIALTDYVFGDPEHQQKVCKAGAIPVLVRLLNEMMASDGDSQPILDTEDVFMKALLTLGSIYALNDPMQRSAVFDGVIPVLEKALITRDNTASDRRRRMKAVMAVRLLVDNRADKEKLAISEQIKTTIHRFSTDPSDREIQNEAKVTLVHLGAAPGG